MNISIIDGPRRYHRLVHTLIDFIVRVFIHKRRVKNDQSSTISRFGVRQRLS